MLYRKTDELSYTVKSSVGLAINFQKRVMVSSQLFFRDFIWVICYNIIVTIYRKQNTLAHGKLQLAAIERLNVLAGQVIPERNDEMESKEIKVFRGEYEFLSNFFNVPIEYKGMYYLNSEAAFQAQKCRTEEEKIPFMTCTATKAKRMGRQVLLRPDWESVKIQLMEEIVRAKFSQNPRLAEKLLKTGDKMLIEGNTWRDTFWGVDLESGKGENHLGQILMKVRSELEEDRSS